MDEQTCLTCGETKPLTEFNQSRGYVRRHCKACRNAKERLRYAGLYVPPPRPSVEERFWSRVEKTDTCWLWTGRTAKNGYGRLTVDGADTRVHRFAYELLVGPIPEGLHIDHLCRVRNCVNPAHMEPVTLVENVMRGLSPAAQHARKTHCKRGHEFTEANTLIGTAGDRICRTCLRQRGRNARARRRAALTSAPN